MRRSRSSGAFGPGSPTDVGRRNLQVRPDQLSARLDRDLAPVYLLSGDEPLQMGECLDGVVAAARSRGFSERVTLHAQKDFDWSALSTYADSLSLFSDKRILDVRLPSAKPGDAGSRALVAWCERPSPDNLLIVSSGRLDGKARRTRWVQALDGTGVSVAIRDVNAGELPAWVTRRARAEGVKLTPDAARALAERVEGNLLACAQEIRKLVLLHGEATVDVPQVLASVADSARFDVFDLVDAALAGDTVRALHVLHGLREEGIAEPLVGWALAREVRALAAMAGELEQGSPPGTVLKRHRVWDSRQALVGGALRRHGARGWRRILRATARADRASKGARGLSAWDELERVTLAMAGVMLFPPNPYNDDAA